MDPDPKLQPLIQYMVGMQIAIAMVARIVCDGKPITLDELMAKLRSAAAASQDGGRTPAAEALYSIAMLLQLDDRGSVQPEDVARLRRNILSNCGLPEE